MTSEWTSAAATRSRLSMTEKEDTEMKYTEPKIDILLFDEEEIMAESGTYSMHQETSYMLDNGANDGVAGVDVRNLKVNITE